MNDTTAKLCVFGRNQPSLEGVIDAYISRLSVEDRRAYRKEEMSLLTGCRA